MKKLLDKMVEAKQLSSMDAEALLGRCEQGNAVPIQS